MESNFAHASSPTGEGGHVAGDLSRESRLLKAFGRRSSSHRSCPTRCRTERAIWPRSPAFTLIELIVVIAIILILAGLVLSTVGYVQKKGARSRCETEIAAMSAALESYKADNGIYPRDSTTTDLLNSTNDGNPADYATACRYMYGEVTGDRDFDGAADSGSRSYITLKPASMLRADMSQPPSSSNRVTAIRDPFGNSYGYSTKMAALGSGGYNPTFDLWSTTGLTTSPPSAADQNQWIKNW